MDAVTTRTADGGAAERRREQRGWYFYDWANSVFSTSVLTVYWGGPIEDERYVLVGSVG